MSGRRFSWDAIVRRADPDRDRELAREPQYQFRDRVFYADRRRTGVFSPRPPLNVLRPTIAGLPLIATFVVCNPGEHIGSPDPSITFQWLVDGVEIDGAEESRFLILRDHIGLLTCAVTASNEAGSVTTTTDPVVVLRQAFQFGRFNERAFQIFIPS